MKRTILISSLAVFFFLSVQSLQAEIRLPALVSSNMVLQRNTTVMLWGWADPGEKITIEASWLNEPLNLEAEAGGNWQVEVETTGSKEPQTLIIRSPSSEFTLGNVVFGEVWLCSGQSNMQQPVRGYDGEPTFGSNMAVAVSGNPDLRLFTVDRIGSKTPLGDVEEYTPWQQASPENVPEFSAIAYFFGQQLQEILDVPVGMIHASWGGSAVQAWISNEVISETQEVDLEQVDITERTNHIPTALYNGMIHPLIPYTIKGVLWYQGESNRMEPEKYKELFPAMVRDWRTRWEIGDFPFYYVQIAPYLYGNNEPFQTFENSAFIREAQLQCLDLIPNSGIAITMDIGDKYSIHPPKKIEVADRLLFNALSRTYGYQTVDGASPEYASHEVVDGGILLKFDHAETGLYAFGRLEGFEIAGENRLFYPAQATIVNRREVSVKSDRVPEPVAVRYAWRNWVVGTLFDTSLLPASSFRTDDWDEAKKFSE